VVDGTNSKSPHFSIRETRFQGWRGMACAERVAQQAASTKSLFMWLGAARRSVHSGTKV
jgi:hypothetical protein